MEKWYSDTDNEYKGFTVKLIADEYPEDPRKQFDHMAHMVCFHNRYELGDPHDFSEPEDLLDFVNRPDVTALPLYLYDHSGLTMRAGNDFSDVDPQGWDSGIVGFIYVTDETVKTEYGNDPNGKDKAIAYMQGEVKEYSAYLEGDVFGWAIKDDEEETVESCFGYYGYHENIDYIMAEVKAIIDHILDKEKAKAQAEADARRQVPAAIALQSANRFNRKG